MPADEEHITYYKYSNTSMKDPYLKRNIYIVFYRK